MRFKLTPRSMLFAVLCVCLTSEELWLKNALAVITGRIVFTSMRDGNAEIYVMDADGGNQENLTNHPAHDGDPDWSPDGTKIAFESWRDGNGEIYVMDADGKNPIRFTDGPGVKTHPDWSPDGGKIAFSVDDLEDYIAVMDADGRNREILDDRAMYPSWSPDGKQIAFVHGEIYVIGVGGQGRKKVTDDFLGGASPSFSPDGRRIASDPSHEGFHHIYVMGADGKNPMRLSHNQAQHSHPTWSPDGGAIAYASSDDGFVSEKIHLMTADGKHIKQLSKVREGIDYQPDFSPVGLAVSPTSKTATIWGRLKKPAPNHR